jgi:hypothetical protein
MTPKLLVEKTKEVFTPLYIKNESVLEALLKKSLRTYQQKAGHLFVVSTTDELTEVDTPDNLLEIATVEDARGRWQRCDPPVEGVITIVPDSKAVAPYRIHCFYDFAGMDIVQDDLPSESVRLIADHVECLIGRENANRARRSSIAAGIPADDIAADDSFIAQLDNIEMDMEENQAHVPMVMVS